MSQINWITPAGSLVTKAEEQYFEFQLDAYDTQGSALTYSIIAGKLSFGLQLIKTGLIQGIPVVEEKSTTAKEFVQVFTIRATNVQGKVCDRTFSITINSIALPQIVPKNVSLGTYYDGYFLDKQLVATDPNPIATLEWTVVDGELPLGLTLTPEGRLYGFLEPYHTAASENVLGWSIVGWDFIPWDIPTAKPQSKTYRFTVQVFDGSRQDNSIYTLNVQAKSLLTTDNDTIIVDNDTLTTDLDNYHFPYIITQPQELTPQRQESNFAFKITGRDLDSSDLVYELITLGAAAFDQGQPGGPGYVIDLGGADSLGPPTLKDPADVPTLPSLSESKFDAAGFDQVDQSLPAGLTLDHATGWLTGTLGAQVEEVKTYIFQVYCYKTVVHRYEDPAFPMGSGHWIEESKEYDSKPVTFTLTVLGDYNNTISWLTPEDLGIMDNGDISEFSIKAVSAKGKTLNYRIKEGERSNNIVSPADEVVTYTPNVKNRLPQGLQLMSNGLIVGRATFEYFSIDGGTTTIDKKTTNFDNKYEFTVTASDDSIPNLLDTASVASDRRFTIRINNYNQIPYENIYLTALPNRDQRAKFLTLLDNTEIFPPELLYRLDDPWFGKAKTIKCLFAAGLTPSLAASYVETMQHNHYNKRVDLGNVKTAVALDANFNVKYEVVYVEVIDETTDNGKSAPLMIDRSSEVKAPYNVMPFTQVYPNSLDNMKTEISNIGYSNKGSLPHWMINPQDDGRVLGFTRAVVLAYTVAGASKLIAYRLQQSNATFNDINFIADRYQLDHTLSENYDIATHQFVKSTETTFDRMPPTNELHPYAGTVDFAVIIPFDEINERTVEYLTRAGGLDGVTDIKNGQLLIFAKQELFVSTTGTTTHKDTFDYNNFDGIGFSLSVEPKVYNTQNDGWNNENGVYGSTLYGSTPYEPAAIVPGYLDSLAGNATNQRSGIWKVEITEEQVVTLVFVKEVKINEYVQVGGGHSYGETKLYYDPVVKPGYSVPAYSILTNVIATSTGATRFDGGGTRFYNNRDMYSLPETNDVFLKFPKTNIYY